MLKKIFLLLTIIPLYTFSQKKNIEIILPSSIRVYETTEANSIEKLIQKNWYSLTDENNFYYLRKTKINISKGYDECASIETRIIENRNSNNLIALLSSNYITKEAKINKIIDSSLILLPKKQFEFNMNNMSYKLKANSTNKLTDYIKNQNFDDMKNYQLTLFNNLTKKQIILYQQTNYVDTLTKIIFIGDLDGDNKPDFIISSPSFYEESKYLVFLSKDFNWKKIIQEPSAIFSNQFDC